jgi:CheY-like chemotaxis protein/anti-sigma regulatory factor (Ser/Thr protein kinase)
VTRILIVDDEPVARQAMADLLAGENYILDFAGDGPTGIALAKAALPDVILLDLMMPGMNGYEVCAQLRADPSLAEIPILMITAYSDRKSRMRAIAAGVDDFIAKPFDGIELLARLRTNARLNRYRRLVDERLRFRWVMDRSNDGYVVVDFAGGVIHANEPAKMYLGLDYTDLLPSESIARIIARTYRLEPPEAWSNWPDTALEDGRCYLVKPETLTAPAFWLSVCEQRIVSGGAAHIVLQLRDVTEAVTSRAEMRSFRTVLAHKLRTPLSAVLGLLGLLNSSLDDLSRTEIKEYLADAHAGAQRLNSAVNDVSSYVGSLSTPNQGVGLVVSDLPATVAAVSAMLGIEDVTLTLDESVYSCALPLAKSAVEQILFELLENSQKFHPVHTPTVTIAVSLAADSVHIAVADNGATLSPQQIKWALTPYLQGEKFFTGETPGMGLGLPLVAALVWQVGGGVQLNNRPLTSGIVVELRLPAAVQTQQPATQTMGASTHTTHNR